jgi:hypothetical protein
MDLNKAVEHVAESTGETPEDIRALVIALGESEADASRLGHEDGRNVTWPYPDEIPMGSIPWEGVVRDHKNVGMTEFHKTPYGVLWAHIPS